MKVGDLKVFMMAILSIKGNKRMFIEKDSDQNATSTIQFSPTKTNRSGTDSNQKKQSVQLSYGWINSEHQLCLTKNDVGRIQ